MLEDRVNEHPGKLLFSFLDKFGNEKEAYTYKQFFDRTSVIASNVFHAHHFSKGDRIILMYPPGLEMICAFFSCVRLGLIPVPVYPPSAHGFKAALRKLEYIVQDCSPSAIMMDNSLYWSLKVNLEREQVNDGEVDGKALSAIPWICTDSFNSLPSGEFIGQHSEILFLQYTSGSTSDPKGVMVTHENIIHNCDIVVDHNPVGVSWLPQYHDMGLIGYYLFFAIKGGTTYGFSPIDFIQRPVLWLETITKYKATASSAPNFAYEYCLSEENVPQEVLGKLDLSSLVFFMNAAEPVQTEVFNAFIKKFHDCGLNPEYFFVAYGLAEFSLAVTNYGRRQITLDAALLKRNIYAASDDKVETVYLASCGRPLGETHIAIVDVTGDPRVLQPGQVGEIWLDGKSKCIGYWNKPELTRNTFHAELPGNADGRTWLRTGDKGFMHEGELYVCGRLKDSIIIRGENYYPQDIEKIIEESSLVRKGCVAAFPVQENGHEVLVIVAGLKNNRKIPDAHQLNTALITQLGIRASEIVFVPARTVARTSSGKIMRYMNRQLFESGELQIIRQVNFNRSNGTTPEPEEENSCRIHPEVKSLFAGYVLTGNEREPLGDCGLDSIRVAEFTHDLEQFLIESGFGDLSSGVDIRLLQKIAVSELAGILSDLKNSSSVSRFRFRQAFNRISSEHEAREANSMRKDAGMELPEFSNKIVIGESFDDKILLTGGTGFFGPFLLRSILQQNHGDVFVTVRAANNEEGKNRLRSAMEELHPDQEIKSAFEKRVAPVCADLSLPGLGLSDTDEKFIGENIRTIYHNGALVNYIFDYETLRNANVQGTQEILRLVASSVPKTLNYISTTFIFGWSVEDTLHETDCNDQMKNLDFGYSQSKWVSEQLVRNALKTGMRGRIFRPALLSPSTEGEGYNFDISMRLLIFMMNHAIGTAAKNQVSFTPADIAANNIVAISNIGESIGRTFHVTRDEYASMMDITSILGKLSGTEFTHYPLHDFIPEVVERCTKNDLLFPLLNFLVRSEKKISAMEFKRYDNSNYIKYRRMSGWGREDIPLEDVVRGIYRFMLKHDVFQPQKITKEWAPAGQ